MRRLHAERALSKSIKRAEPRIEITGTGGGPHSDVVVVGGADADRNGSRGVRASIEARGPFTFAVTISCGDGLWEFCEGVGDSTPRWGGSCHRRPCRRQRPIHSAPCFLPAQGRCTVSGIASIAPVSVAGGFPASDGNRWRSLLLDGLLPIQLEHQSFELFVEREALGYPLASDVQIFRLAPDSEI
jgi:hypothetical protein